MTERTWAISGTWDEMERVRADIDSHIYRLQEDAADFGTQYRVTLRVEEAGK